MNLGVYGVIGDLVLGGDRVIGDVFTVESPTWPTAATAAHMPWDLYRRPTSKCPVHPSCVLGRLDELVKLWGSTMLPATETSHTSCVRTFLGPPSSVGMAGLAASHCRAKSSSQPRIARCQGKTIYLEPPIQETRGSDVESQWELHGLH